MAAFGTGTASAHDPATPDAVAPSFVRGGGRLAMTPSERVPVMLVGAGAGDAGDLTLRAYTALQTADIVFYDDLVDSSVLALIPARVEQVFVGKRAGRTSTPQPDIHTLMTDAARSGRRVVRLKGGDPFVFGRGSEEAEALKLADLETEIVPGLTAALVCAASSGIPLTDRRYSAQVTFITATRTDGALNDLRGLAGPGRTLVVYMGGRAANRIANVLIDDRVPAATPAALIENGGRADQRVTETTLGALAGGTRNPPGEGPVLLIIGDVIRARITAARNAPSFSASEISYV